MAKRTVTPISLAFLDIMFCGFGAVVLLVMILNGDVLRKREQHSQDLRAELDRATALEAFARDYLEKLKTEIDAAGLREGELHLQATELETKIRAASDETKRTEAQAESTRGSIAAIQTQSAALQSAIQLLRAKAADNWRGGRRPVGFTGDGQRQYLTGLKLGGERTLILLDSSASMLDETVVNVIRRKLMNPAARQSAPKWQRTLRTLHWVVANLRPGKQFQVYQFNTQATPLLSGSDRKWLSTDDSKQLGTILSSARQIAPIGGTSFHRAFSVIGSLDPRPDSVVILTDGLPTQGGSAIGPGMVSAQERLNFFVDSIQLIPADVAVNTLLFPMEGDPFAASAFWQLAISTKGSFITPSRDWP